jgi:hypothetical protein
MSLLAKACCRRVHGSVNSVAFRLVDLATLKPSEHGNGDDAGKVGSRRERPAVGTRCPIPLCPESCRGESWHEFREKRSLGNGRGRGALTASKCCR